MLLITHLQYKLSFYLHLSLTFYRYLLVIELVPQLCTGMLGIMAYQP
jgi:hypothetical protein